MKLATVFIDLLQLVFQGGHSPSLLLLKHFLFYFLFCFWIFFRGVATGWISVFIPPKSAQVNFLWGKNDVRTAIQQFYTPKKTYTPQNKFMATPLIFLFPFVVICTNISNCIKRSITLKWKECLMLWLLIWMKICSWSLKIHKAVVGFAPAFSAVYSRMWKNY